MRAPLNLDGLKAKPGLYFRGVNKLYSWLGAIGYDAYAPSRTSDLARTQTDSRRHVPASIYIYLGRDDVHEGSSAGTSPCAPSHQERTYTP